MAKIDFKKELKEYYGGKVGLNRIVKVPAMNFIIIDGKGNPNTSKEYADAISALFKLSYTIKFIIKKELKKDYGVMPLEGLWYVDDMSRFSTASKDDWKWVAMIMQPELVTKAIYARAVKSVMEKDGPAAVSKARLESFSEGVSVQTMYVGPYADEGPTIKAMHEFGFKEGYELSGKHHEIYLSDFRKTKPEKLKTVIRQPLKKKG